MSIDVGAVVAKMHLDCRSCLIYNPFVTQARLLPTNGARILWLHSLPGVEECLHTGWIKA